MFKFFLILSFILRLVLMPISAHSDIFFINSFPNLLVTNKVLDITSFVGEHFENRNYTYYSPLTYYTFGLFQYLYTNISNSFSPWMSQLFNLDQNGFDGQAADYIKATKNPHIYKDLFLAKTPYLLFDIASVLVLFKLVKDKLIRKAAILVWLLNPVNLYATYIMGQFDIIPTFFVLLAFYLLRKNVTACIFILGVSAAYKNFAFLFLLPVAIIYGDTWLKRLRLVAVGLITYFLFLVPTLTGDFHQAFYQIVPKAYLHYRKPLEGWVLYSQTIKYALLGTAYFLIVTLSAALKIKNKWKFSSLISLAAIATVYAIAPRISFHYLLWATPLIIISIKNVKFVSILIAAQAISLASYKLLVNHLQFGLFAPLNPDYFASLPTLNSEIDKIIPYQIVSTIGFFIFFSINLLIATVAINKILFQSEIAKQK